MTEPTTTAQRLASHEEICGVRYGAINARLKRIEGIMIASAGGTILLLAGFVLKAI